MTTIQKYAAVPGIIMLLLAGGAIAGYASMANAQGSAASEKPFMIAFDGKAVHGTIASINGSSFTLTNEEGTTYTVNAENAEIHKFVEGQPPVDGTVADLAVGDRVGVHGDISGTTVTANTVIDGIPEHGKFMMRHGVPGMKGLGVAGEVTAKDGSTITVKGKDGTTYTVQAGNAAVHKMTVGTLADVVVGDTIGVHGSVEGNTVTAEVIMDDAAAMHDVVFKSRQ